MQHNVDYSPTGLTVRNGAGSESSARVVTLALDSDPCSISESEYITHGKLKLCGLTLATVLVFTLTPKILKHGQCAQLSSGIKYRISATNRAQIINVMPDTFTVSQLPEYIIVFTPPGQWLTTTGCEAPTRCVFRWQGSIRT